MPEPAPPNYPDHTALLEVRDSRGEPRPIETPADWAVRRAHVMAHVREVMGDLPGGGRRVPLDVEVVEERDRSGFAMRKLTFASEPGDRVPAWLLIPKAGPPAGGYPAMLCLHPTWKTGKDEQVGIDARPNRAIGAELADNGYVVLAPDYPRFGDYEVDPYALGYVSASMKAVWNNMRGVDLLASLPEVDPRRIGAIGHSLGGHNAIFTALFDDRIRAVVSSCGFNAFTHYEGGDLSGWSHRGYMPRIRSRYAADAARMPFDFPELIAALAPRAFFTSSPLHDFNFPVEGVYVCLEAARPVFDLLGVGDRLAAVHPDCAHDFPPEARERAYAFLRGGLDGADT